jgi:hypothetical protein
VRLKKAHLAYLLHADARGCDIGDRAVGEFEPRAVNSPTR